jgi:hypothetical protein
MFGVTMYSECPPRAVVCNSGSMRELSVEMSAESGTVSISG